MDLSDRIGRKIKLRELHVLLSVAENGTMAKAARALAVSQPVVSKAIADLEHVLGVRLLDRSRHGAELTIYGRAILQRGVAAFDEIRQGVKEVDFLSDPSTGDVKIGAHASMVAGLLPVVIDLIRQRHPRIDLQVSQLYTHPTLYDDLRQRQFDFILGRLLRRPAENDLDIETLFNEPLSVVVGTNSVWARRRKINLSDLVDDAWVLPQLTTDVGGLMIDVFRSSGVDVPKHPVICSSIDLYWTLLASGRFLAILPHSVLKYSVCKSLIRILPVKIQAPPRPVGIVTYKRRTLSPSAILFIEEVRRFAKKIKQEL